MGFWKAELDTRVNISASMRQQKILQIYNIKFNSDVIPKTYFILFDYLFMHEFPLHKMAVDHKRELDHNSQIFISD